ncbi:MAG TPA: C39 family peptidase [Candidatus Obscuribacterales bacterium]
MFCKPLARKTITLAICAGILCAFSYSFCLPIVCVPAGAAEAANNSAIADKRLEELKLIRVPLARQATDYTCGAAAMQSVLGYYGDDFAESDLAKELRTNSKQGTDYKRMVEFARSKGYTAELKQGMQVEELKKKLDAGLPVICLIQAWPEKPVDVSADWKDGHYVVAIGYDEQNVYFMDPWTLGNYTFIPTEEFLKRWHDKEQNRKLLQLAMVINKPIPHYDPFAIKRVR